MWFIVPFRILDAMNSNSTPQTLYIRCLNVRNICIHGERRENEHTKRRRDSKHIFFLCVLLLYCFLRWSSPYSPIRVHNNPSLLIFFSKIKHKHTRDKQKIIFNFKHTFSFRNNALKSFFNSPK